jgi:hypothetical protein
MCKLERSDIRIAAALGREINIAYKHHKNKNES